jgi:hypothetical protein
MNECRWWIRRGARGVGVSCVLLMLASTWVPGPTAIRGKADMN